MNRPMKLWYFVVGVGIAIIAVVLYFKLRQKRMQREVVG